MNSFITPDFETKKILRKNIAISTKKKKIRKKYDFALIVSKLDFKDFRLRNSKRKIDFKKNVKKKIKIDKLR